MLDRYLSRWPYAAPRAPANKTTLKYKQNTDACFNAEINRHGCMSTLKRSLRPSCKPTLRVEFSGGVARAFSDFTPSKQAPDPVETINMQDAGM